LFSPPFPDFSFVPIVSNMVLSLPRIVPVLPIPYMPVFTNPIPPLPLHGIPIEVLGLSAPFTLVDPQPPTAVNIVWPYIVTIVKLPSPPLSFVQFLQFQ